MRTPAVTTCTTVNPAACATGVVPSAPRVTVHETPEIAVTAMISVEAAGAVSAIWNWVAPVSTVGNEADEATAHVSTVPCAGESVPPLVTVVDGRSAKTSSGVGDTGSAAH